MDLHQAILKARTERGLTQQQVASAIGVSRPAVGQWETGDKRPSTENLMKLLKLFRQNITTKYGGEIDGDPSKKVPFSLMQAIITLSGAVERSTEEDRSILEAAHNNYEGPVANATIGDRISFSREMTHIYGQAAGGPDGKFYLNGEIVDSVLTPPSLANLKGAYGVYVHGTSMLERFKHGEIVFAAPYRPYTKGDDVIVQLKPDSEEPMPFGYVKRFESLDAKKLVLRQLNPPEGEEEFITFPRRQVESIHKIVTSVMI